MIRLKDLIQEQTTTLRRGSRGKKVEELQKQLIQLGYLPPTQSNGRTSADGVFGSGTKAAVEAFQKNNKLSPDGIVGRNTFSALKKSKVNKKQSTDTPDTELPYTQYRNVSDVSQIISDLFSASRGMGTDEEALRYAIRRIKDKQTYDQVNKVLKSYQKLALRSGPNEPIQIGNYPPLNSDWSEDYGSIEDILDGEYGYFDAEDKQLSYNILNKIKGKGDAYGRDKDQDLNLGPIAWFKSKIFPQLNKVLFKVAPQVAQYLMPKTMTTVDFSDSDRKFLGDVISNAIRRGVNPKFGAIGYQDYSPDIQKLLEGGMTEPTSWIKLLGGILKNDASVTGGVKGFQFATLLGRFTFKKKNDGNYKIEPDTYDFSKGISISNNVLINELQGLTWAESIKYIMQKNANLQGGKGVYQAIRHIGHLENPQGGTRPDGSALASISVDDIQIT